MRLLVISFILLTTTVLSAQLPQNSIGNNPSGQKWSQISNERVQVVFPRGQEESGLRVASLVDRLWHFDTLTIGKRTDKVSIFLQGERVLSNGLVTVGPFRSEFYQTPSQFANSTEYIDLLTIHEYRHVQQFSNATQGITKLVKNTLGSWGWGGMMALALPRWYFEGDATIAETAFSRSGRGRLPSFNMQYYAWYDAGIKYGFEKTSARSLKDYTPDWYPLGYEMLSYGRRHHGPMLWHRVATDAVNYRGLFYPFYRGIKRYTGLSIHELYKNTMQDGLDRWAQMTANAEEYTRVSPPATATVSDYTTPTPWYKSLVVSRRSFDEIAAYYRIDPDGSMSKLIEHGILTDQEFGTLSIVGNKMCWAELGFDPRWRFRQSSDVFVYNFIKDSKERITSKERYFSPVFSPDARTIAVVEITPEQENRIIILDASTGEPQEVINNPEGYLLTHPSWIDDTQLAFIRTKDELSQIAVIDMESKVTEPITTGSSHQLSHLYCHDGWIYYAASYLPINNIYRVRITTGAIEQITNARVSAFQPSVRDSMLYFSEFTNDGFKVSQLDLTKRKIIGYKAERRPEIRPVAVLEEQGGTSAMEDLEEKDWTIKKYNKWSGLLRPHSLVPEWDDPFVTIRVLSDNKFSTLSAEANATFNYNEDEWTYNVGMRYAELYPIITANYSHGFRSALFFNFQGLSDTSLVQTNFVERWTEDRITAGVTLPYNFSRGNMANTLQLRANVSRTSFDSNDRFSDPEFSRRDTFSFDEGNRSRLASVYSQPIGDGSITTLDLTFSGGMIKRRALQHIQPRMGIVLFSRWRKNLSNEALGGDVFTAASDIYLPGIAKNHSFFMNLMYQKESMLDNYRYGDIFAYPRGYNRSLRQDNFFKVGLNYTFPIAYPDLALGGLAFIKRIKGNTFYDFGRFGVESFPFQQGSVQMSSAGFELGMDFRAFRLVEIDLGVRWSYLLDSGFLSEGQSRHQFDFFVLSITE